MPKSENFIDRLKQDRKVTSTVNVMYLVIARFARVREKACRISLRDVRAPSANDSSTAVKPREVLGLEMRDLSRKSPEAREESHLLDFGDFGVSARLRVCGGDRRGLIRRRIEWGARN
jgi:hypothetical protein